MPPRASSMPQPWPAVSPDHTKLIERLSLGAVRKRPTCGSPTTVADDRSWEAHAVEHILSGRETVDQDLGCEIAFRQRIDERAAVDVLEAVGGGKLHQHARRRSTRAQTTPESTEMSPDCTPWLIAGRSLARLMKGLAMPPKPVNAVAATPVARKRRLSVMMRPLMVASACEWMATRCLPPLTIRRPAT